MIKEINKTIFSKADKPRFRINMITKGPSRKQIIIPMGINNTNKFMSVSSKHIVVIRRECGQTLGLGLVDRNRTVVNY